MSQNSCREIIRNSCALGIRPDPILTVTTWSDSYRELTAKSSPEPGRWKTSRTPYLKDIMDCLSSNSPYQEIVFVKGSQVGGTEIGNNWIGYIIDHVPGPTLLVQPTSEAAKKNSKMRIAPLIASCSRLRDKVTDSSRRDAGNTILEKEFPNGILVMTGSNSSVGLRSTPVKYLFLDETDAYPGDVDGEGDPVDLAMARTSNFVERKIYAVSTPTLEGRSRIQRAYEETDQRRYWVPCPICKEFQTLKWAQVRWPENKPLQAHYQCEHCNGAIEEHHKTNLLAHGEWRPDRPDLGNGLSVGFHLSALYSPWYKWGTAAQKFLKAKKNQESMRVFVNTFLGETWKDVAEVPDYKRLYERRESYTVNTIPPDSGVLILTAAADIQKDRIEVEIVGWGEDKQSWSIDYRVFEGSTATDVPWNKLDEILDERWTLRNGVSIQIQKLAVDSGNWSQIVYAWARKKPMDRILVVKGSPALNYALGQATPIDSKASGKKIYRGVKLWHVGNYQLKRELYSNLRLDKPVDGEPYPPGYCHFPEYGEEFFKQLTAEQLKERVEHGYKKYRWEKIRSRNEVLDCRVYARAASIAFGIDRMTPSDWKSLKMELGLFREITIPKEEVAKEPTTQTPQVRSPAFNRRKPQEKGFHRTILDELEERKRARQRWY